MGSDHDLMMVTFRVRRIKARKQNRPRHDIREASNVNVVSSL